MANVMTRSGGIGSREEAAALPNVNTTYSKLSK
jgi:hypothetical protein